MTTKMERKDIVATKNITKFFTYTSSHHLFQFKLVNKFGNSYCISPECPASELEHPLTVAYDLLRMYVDRHSTGVKMRLGN